MEAQIQEALGVIPPAVRQGALEIVRRQTITPVSPGVMLEEQPQLCAAAAIAVASRRLSGDEASADQLALEVARDGNRDGVFAEFENQGWGRDRAQTIFIANDRLAQAARTEGVARLLSS